jgi:hypothetical protein
MFKTCLALFLMASAAFGCRGAPAPSSSPDPSGHADLTYGSQPKPGLASFFYSAGTAGTVTVPANAYVSGIAAHATNSGATLTLTPEGPGVIDASAGTAIPIPAGVGFALGRPVLYGSTFELGPGTIIVTSGTDSYFVAMVQTQ